MTVRGHLFDVLDLELRIVREYCQGRLFRILMRSMCGQARAQRLRKYLRPVTFVC
jgi:hypothetical protein